MMRPSVLLARGCGARRLLHLTRATTGATRRYHDPPPTCASTSGRGSRPSSSAATFNAAVVGARRPVSLQRSPQQGASLPFSTGSGDRHGGGLGVFLDLDLHNFDAVMEGSHEVATIIDCHANWCHPCRTLGPMLVKAVGDAEGRLRLAKMDVDDNPALAHDLRVEYMPTVYAVVNQKVVEKFVGVLQQPDLDTFIANVLKHEPDNEFQGKLE